jgi:hypothetical protein
MYAQKPQRDSDDDDSSYDDKKIKEQLSNPYGDE